MNKMSWQYLAGYIDGEGRLLMGISRDKRAKSRGKVNGWNLLPNLCVASYDQEVLSTIKEFLEGEGIKVYKLERRKKHGVNLQDSVRLSILGWDNILKTIKKLIPYIIDKRRQFELFKELHSVVKNKPLHETNPYHKRIWTKGHFLKAMGIVDEINANKKGLRGKYNMKYFENLWKGGHPRG